MSKKGKFQNRRKCYVCGGKLIWDSEELIDDEPERRRMRFEIYLHCVSCNAMILYAIPIIDDRPESGVK